MSDLAARREIVCTKVLVTRQRRMFVVIKLYGSRWQSQYSPAVHHDITKLNLHSYNVFSRVRPISVYALYV